MIGCIGHDGDCCTDRESLVKDAERYRFLRAQHEDPQGDFDVEKWKHGQWIQVKDLDVAIDKAMEKT